jgi:hypothetical protein
VPFDGVRVERMTLFHRSGRREDYDPTPMTSNGRSFIGIITGDVVHEGGVEFYVMAENSGFVVTDPPEGDRRPFRVDIEPPHEFAFNPVVRNPGFTWKVGENIDFMMALARGTVFERGTLWYRRGGDTTYQSTDILELSFTGISASIPGTEVGPRGVEYWAEIQTLTTTLTDPRSDPARHPLELRVSADNLAESGSTPAERYRLLSIPLEAPPATGLATILSDQREFGPYDPARWRAFRYVPELGRNVELPEDPSRFVLEPGRAFWVVSREAHRVDTAPVPMLSTQVAQPYVILLAPGWNAIGNPYPYPIAWSSVRGRLGIGDPVAFDPERNDYREGSADTLQPFQGYFVENTTGVQETLYVEAQAHSAAGRSPAALHTGGEATVSLEAVTARGADRSNRIGVAADAAAQRDARDQGEPPQPPGAAVRLSIANRDWSGAPGLYRRDIRPAGGEGHTWEIEVASASAGEPVDIVLAGDLAGVGDAVRVVDREQGTIHEVAPGPDGGFRLTIVSFGPDRPYRLALVAGSAGYVSREAAPGAAPERLTLDAAAPNPAREALRVRFGLPRAGAVDLEVFDLGGRRIATLLDGRAMPAGFHSVVWRGERDHGGAASSGVYFYRLTAGGETRTRRVTLVR